MSGKCVVKSSHFPKITLKSASDLPKKWRFDRFEIGEEELALELRSESKN